ncbi:MAG: VWA domain-containing protein [Roseiflexaceae bacterium]
MDQRVIDFITALRAAGVRVSIAESADALRAIEAAGIASKDLFRVALRATLVKEQCDIGTFEQLFGQYFGQADPPMQQTGGGMSDEQREQMMQALMQMLQNMTPEQLRELFEAMMTGQQLSREQLQQLLEQTSPMQNPMPGMPMGGMPFSSWALQRAMRQAMREIEFDKLDEFMRELLDKLREAGISDEALQQLEQEARQNQQALAQQLARELGQGLAQQAAEQRQRQQRSEELLDKPFEHMSSEDSQDLRPIVTRLAAQLRSRAALRQKRARKGNLDAKATIRANLHYTGVPIELKHRHKHLKPRLVIICDRSRSTEEVVRFLLLLIYALQDQVSQTRSFAFIETIYDISTYFAEHRPERAIDEVMQNVYSKRSYSTDLGESLRAFIHEYAGVVDRRTTVIVLGDGRNNENDPGLRHFEDLKRRARRIVWFNPEHPSMWGRYDPGSLSSDMLKYLPMCDAVHHVSNLRQLVVAVDSLFS